VPAPMASAAQTEANRRNLRNRAGPSTSCEMLKAQTDSGPRNPLSDLPTENIRVAVVEEHPAIHSTEVELSPNSGEQLPILLSRRTKIRSPTSTNLPREIALASVSAQDKSPFAISPFPRNGNC
jgi:hypothetical protein